MTYTLDDIDKKRIRCLVNESANRSINFKYFITLNYDTRVTDITEVWKDNQHLKKILRFHFKRPIKFLFTTELHLKDPNSYYYNSYHRHILMEGIKGVHHNKIRHVLRHHHSIATDTKYRKGCDIKPIEDLNNVMSYVTKQIDNSSLSKNDKKYIIDSKNSDIGTNHYSIYGESRDEYIYHSFRPNRLLERTHKVLSRVH
tara:strand:- start:274 stop:873 length:600 start_codon:yes stop_codon:yes gene_type:complete